LGPKFLEIIKRMLSRMELYFYEDCEYSQIVMNTIFKLEIKDKFTFKDIRLNPDYGKELVDLTGDITVPCLVNSEGHMKEAKDIRKYLVSHFI
jgi:glutaredoxin 2